MLVLHTENTHHSFSRVQLQKPRKTQIFEALALKMCN